VRFKFFLLIYFSIIVSAQALHYNPNSVILIVTNTELENINADAEKLKSFDRISLMFGVEEDQVRNIRFLIQTLFDPRQKHIDIIRSQALCLDYINSMLHELHRVVNPKFPEDRMFPFLKVIQEESKSGKKYNTIEVKFLTAQEYNEQPLLGEHTTTLPGIFSALKFHVIFYSKSNSNILDHPNVVKYLTGDTRAQRSDKLFSCDSILSKMIALYGIDGLRCYCNILAKCGESQGEESPFKKLAQAAKELRPNPYLAAELSKQEKAKKSWMPGWMSSIFWPSSQNPERQNLIPSMGNKQKNN
jgi:hypothetical protein